MISQPPPSRLDTWLAGLPGEHVAALVIFTFVAIAVLCMVPSIVARCSKPEAARRRATSNRKAGHVRVPAPRSGSEVRR